MSTFKVGIDLGTTNSSCCTVENGKFKFLKFKGKEFIKSALLYKDGKLTIGEKAKKKSVVYPENYISSSKTFMGDDNKSWVIDNRIFTPTDVASEILNEIKSKIQSSWQITKNIEAVITVPAYFSSNQIKETKKAGEKSGFIVKQIVTEPVTAAMAYGFEDETNQRLLIIDIGGGTFDVSILNVEEGKNFKTIAVDGDKKLGGDNFDEIIYEILLTNIRKEIGVNLKTFKKSELLKEDYLKVKQVLKVEAEKKKIELSKVDIIDIDIPNLFIKDRITFNLSLKIRREEFEKKANLLLKKINKVILRVLEDNNILDNTIDKVVLVGGSSYIPSIQKIIKDIFNKAPYSDKPLDKLVVMGAALYADSESNSITLFDKISHSLGIELDGKKFGKILNKNQNYPISVSSNFTTVVDNQERLKISVFEGEDEENIYNNYFYGSFNLDGIEKAEAGKPIIEINFDFDKNRILTVTAKDLNTNSYKKEVLEVNKENNKYKNYRVKDIDKKLNKVGIEKLDILVVGVTGAGKSTTLNTFFQKDIAKVGVGVEPETMGLTSYNLNNLISLWDSPGFGDGIRQDEKHAEKVIKILKKKYEKNGDNHKWIDLVLVVIEGINKDMGTTYSILEKVILPNFSNKKILVAINQADVAMKGRNWNHKESKPEAKLLKYLEEQSLSIQDRILTNTGIKILKPIYYSAEYNYNINILFDFIIDNIN